MEDKEKSNEQESEDQQDSQTSNIQPFDGESEPPPTNPGDPIGPGKTP